MSDDGRAALAWMREHGGLLREFVGDERERDPDDSPGGDGAVRAHLRLAAAAVAATGPPALRDALTGFAEDLPEWFEEGRGLYEEHLDTGHGAIALEQHLQFGTEPGRDPSLDAGLHRRLRIGGWIRVFLLGLEIRLGPSADGLAQEVLDGMGTRHRELSRLILALDMEAKAAARRSSADAATDLELQDGIGQAATVQGHVRIMVEELTAALGRVPG
ncbi:MAG: hypothetical protein AB7V62_14020 [Thermoleophilia bacterium]